ncbi:MAG TPA: PepSY domain-containing protein [Pseudolabrys sp.]|nr:PepSY domain-containing protein [Pseudolabrys sp.]
MPKITPFRTAAGSPGIAALAKTSAFAIALALVGFTASAQAGSLGRPCTAAPQNEWLSLEALQSKVEATGFNARNDWQVQKAKLKNSCAEFYVTSKTGARMELFVDPATGTVIDGR